MRFAIGVAALVGAGAAIFTSAATTQGASARTTARRMPPRARPCPRRRVVQIDPRGGTIRMPRCDGNVFTVGYPPNTAVDHFDVTFITYDDASQLPPSGKFGKPAGGTVIAWFEGFSDRNYVMIFCSNQCAPKTATFTGPGVLPSQPYLLYWYDDGSPQGYPERLGYPTCTNGTCTLGPFRSPFEGASVYWYDQDWYEIIRE